MKPALKASYRNVYLRSICCRTILGSPRGLQDDALSAYSIESKADFGPSSTRDDFPATALKPLQLPVVSVHFRRQCKHREVLLSGL